MTDKEFNVLMGAVVGFPNIKYCEDVGELVVEYNPGSVCGIHPGKAAGRRKSGASAWLMKNTCQARRNLP